MAASRKWLFKNTFRARVYGWRGSKLAISRLKEAASEIRSVAKSDPVTAGEGTVSLMERIWPAFQDIDTSSGALGTAVARTLSELIPILADAPADHATRSKWLERLFEAVQNDGVEYLGPVEERWGEIAHYPDLINEYADRLIEMVRRAWSAARTVSWNNSRPGLQGSCPSLASSWCAHPVAPIRCAAVNRYATAPSASDRGGL